MSLHLVRPLGFRSDGRPFWAYFGGAPDDGGGGESTSKADDDGDDSDDDDTDENDPVKKLERSLAAARADAKKARDELRPFKAVLRASGVHSADDLAGRLGGGSTGGTRKGGQQDTPVDVEAIRKEAREAARREANENIVRAKIEARATGKLADPEDAVNALAGQWEDFLDTKGNVDVKDIDHALSDLLARKPHFKIPSGDKAPGFDGGARSNSAGQAQSMDNWLRDKSAAKRGGR